MNICPEQIIGKLRALLPIAYVPYSTIQVAAAVVWQQDGVEQLDVGINVENVSYGLTNCGERTAVFSAVTKGMRQITAVYVMSNLPKPVLPCGGCRQVLLEFASSGDMPITCLNQQGHQQQYTLNQLLPHAFNARL